MNSNVDLMNHVFFNLTRRMGLAISLVAMEKEKVWWTIGIHWINELM